MTKQLRLGGFFSVPGNHLAGWRHPDAVPTYDMDFQGYAHITQVAEAAKFDTIFFQDTVGVAGSRALAVLILKVVEFNGEWDSLWEAAPAAA